MTTDEKPTRRGESAIRKERHARASRLFLELLELEAEDRPVALSERTAEDPDLRAEVSRLLSHADGPDFSQGLHVGVAGAADAFLQQQSVPEQVGHHVIEEEIGRGGMGVVYRALDTHLDRRVALKALPPGIGRDPEAVSRLEREAKLLASLSHPNVATVHGLEIGSDWPHLVLEHVEGETLSARLARGPMPLDEALDVSVQVARGMEAAHAQGILHRDIKPGNVMVTPEGAIKVLDFGLAKVLGAVVASRDSGGPTAAGEGVSLDGIVLGTPGYMSPEQAEGDPVNERTDVWSFGCLMYECLAGRPAFTGSSVQERINAVLEQDPDWSALPADTPQAARDLLRACLQREVARRPRNGGEVRWALDAAQSEGRGPSGWRSLVPVGVATAIAFAALALVVTLTSRPEPVFDFEVQLMAEQLLPSGDYGTVRLTDELVLEEGDGLYFSGLRINQDAALQVFLLSPDGSVALLYPEGERTRPPPLAGGQDHRIPGEGLWRLDDAVGTETLFVAATDDGAPDALALLDRLDAAVREAGPVLLAARTRGASRASNRSAHADREQAVLELLTEQFPRVQTFHVRHGR